MTAERSFRERIYHFIDNEEEQSVGSQTFEIIITILILMSIVAIVLESFSFIQLAYGFYFDTFENITLGIFTVEYLLRIYTADFKFKEAPTWGNAAWKLIKSGSGLVDLLAISPIFFQIFASVGLINMASQDLRFVRILKITRLLRVFKMNSFTNSIAVIVDVCVEKRHDLGITVFVTFILLFVSATLMWYLEGDDQPDKLPNIIATFWWAIATLTTVGYGDVYPVTPMGKFMAGIIALLGIGLVALPAGILSSAFIEKLEDGTIKEEDVEDYVPRGELPQAQFTKKSSKKKDKRKKKPKNSASSEKDIGYQPLIFKPQQNVSGSCQAKFGQAFVYCPYCGKKLEDHD